MRMHVRSRIVPVRMAVLTIERRIMKVVVMSVVVAMGVLVLHGIMRVLVAVLFGQVQVHAKPEEQRCRQHGQEGRAIAHRPRHTRTRKWSDRENGTSPARSDLPLGQEVEAQAQPVTGGAAREQRGSWSHLGESLSQREGQCETEGSSEACLPTNHARRIQIGKRPGEGVVQRPAERGDDNRNRAPSHAPGFRSTCEDQTHSRDNHERDRERDPSAHVLMKEEPAEQDREDSLEVQQQRRAGGARVLETPGERNRSHHSTENRHGKQSGNVRATDSRLFVLSARQPQRGKRCSEIEQRCGRHGPRTMTKALNERRGNTEHESGEHR